MMRKYGLETFKITKANVSGNYKPFGEYFAIDDEFYDDESLDLFNDYYHEDFEKFGYTKL